MYLFRLIYYSRNLIPDQDAPQRRELKDIIEACRRNNPPFGVTGALLFNQSYFAQVLEGDRKAVTETFCRICSDPRHSDLVILEARPITQRRFANWSMGFVSAEVAEEVHRRYCISSQFNPAKMTADSLLGFMVELCEAAPQTVRPIHPQTTAERARDAAPA